MKKSKNPIIITVTVIAVMLMITFTTLFVINYKGNVAPESTTHIAQSEQESSTKAEPQFIEATDADIDHLCNVMEYIAYMSDGEYSSTQQGAWEIAYGWITNPLVGVYGYYDDHYNWNSDFDTNVPCPENPDRDSGWGWLPGDPLERFKETYAYAKYPADKVDWIMKNAFGLEVDRSAETDMWYYHEGYYYLPSGDGGDMMYTGTVNSCTLQPDGTYYADIIMSHYEDVFYKCCVTAQLKNVDGVNCWYIMSFTNI